MKKVFLSVLLLGLFCASVYAQTITPIATIVDNFASYEGQSFTISGVISIGTEQLPANQTGRLRAFIQDHSGKGITLDNSSITSVHRQYIRRGYVVQLTGTVGIYGGAPQLSNLTNIEHRDFEVLEALNLTLRQAENHREHYGLFVKVSGIITAIREPAGQGRDVLISDTTIGNRSVVVRIWDTFNFDISEFEVGTPVEVRGAVSAFNNNTQIVPGYHDELVIREIEPPGDFEGVKITIAPRVYNVFDGELVEIKFSAKASSIVVIRIYNSEGKLIATPMNMISPIEDGEFPFEWDGRDKDFRLVEPGLYICHLEMRDRTTGAIKNATAPIVIGTRLGRR